MFMALAYAVREARADTLQFRSVFLATDHARVLQDIVLHLDYLQSELPAFSDDGARERWMTDPALQPTRRLVERLATCRDWAEIFFAVTMVIEPLLGRFAKAELFSGLAARFGDRSTPLVLAQCELDRAEAVRAGQALVELARADTLFGTSNDQKLREWSDDWGSACADACGALLLVWSRCGMSADEQATALERAVAGHREVVSNAGLC
jgi:hypothetical protein